jgi:hypothetical protein
MLFDEKCGALRLCYSLSLLSYHSIPLRPKCFPQHCTPSAYVPSSVWVTRSCSYANNRQNCSFVCFEFCVFGKQMEGKIIYTE